MKTLTFTMEDALISPEGMAILTGAGLIEASSSDPIYVHQTLEMKVPATVSATNGVVAADTTGFKLKDANGDEVKNITTEGADGTKYPLFMFIKDKNGYIVSEPFSTETSSGGAGQLKVTSDKVTIEKDSNAIPGLKTLDNCTLFFDFYVKKESQAKQIDIGYDKFAGNYYIEASTLFRDQATGRDDPAEFIIPNGKIQTNFTFTMAGTGDPSSFSFTVDALRGRVKGGTTDCLAAIQIVDTGKTDDTEDGRTSTTYVKN